MPRDLRTESVGGASPLALLALGLAALSGVLDSCRNNAPPAGPPPPEVTVVTIQPQTIPAQLEWVAEAAASKSVQVRAQVSGVIVARPYVEGTDVRKGTVLFRIDPRTYEANFRSAEARVAESEAGESGGFAHPVLNHPEGMASLTTPPPGGTVHPSISPPGS